MQLSENKERHDLRLPAGRAELGPSSNSWRMAKGEVVLPHEKDAENRLVGVCTSRWRLLDPCRIRQLDPALHNDRARFIDENREYRSSSRTGDRSCDWGPADW